MQCLPEGGILQLLDGSEFVINLKIGIVYLTVLLFYSVILEQMGINGMVTPEQARKRWTNMCQKYKVLDKLSCG